MIIFFILGIVIGMTPGKREYDNEKNWTQVLYKNKFYNPIIQNRNHIKALTNILGVEDVHIFRSYIVFSE